MNRILSKIILVSFICVLTGCISNGVLTGLPEARQETSTGVINWPPRLYGGYKIHPVETRTVSSVCLSFSDGSEACSPPEVQEKSFKVQIETPSGEQVDMPETFDSGNKAVESAMGTINQLRNLQNSLRPYTETRDVRETRLLSNNVQRVQHNSSDVVIKSQSPVARTCQNTAVRNDCSEWMSTGEEEHYTVEIDGVDYGGDFRSPDEALEWSTNYLNTSSPDSPSSVPEQNGEVVEQTVEETEEALDEAVATTEADAAEAEALEQANKAAEDDFCTAHPSAPECY